MNACETIAYTLRALQILKATPPANRRPMGIRSSVCAYYHEFIQKRQSPEAAWAEREEFERGSYTLLCKVFESWPEARPWSDKGFPVNGRSVYHWEQVHHRTWENQRRIELLDFCISTLDRVLIEELNV